MTPSEDLLAGSQRQSFDGTEYRSIFSAGWRKKFFCGQAQKKGAALRSFGDLRLWGAVFTAAAVLLVYAAAGQF